VKYLDFKKLFEEKSNFVSSFVDKVHSQIDSNSLTIESVKSSLGFSDHDAKAFILNTKALRHVKRKTGEPYSTHPTRAALVAKELLNESIQGEVEIILMHDYLEEGIGVSVQNYKDELAKYPLFQKGLFGSLVLTEPMLDYEKFSGPKKLLQYIAYVEVIFSLKDHLSQDYFNALIFDKLDNIECWDYITKNPNFTDERKSHKLHQKLVYYEYILEHLGGLAYPKVSSILEQAVDFWKVELGLSEPELSKHRESYNQQRQVFLRESKLVLPSYASSLLK
jgi:hypothetical protein